MFCCFLHGWYSTEAPCPACHQTYTTSTSDSSNPEPIKIEPEIYDYERKFFVDGREYVPKETTQPLSGELITKEECERLKREAFKAARIRGGQIPTNPTGLYPYFTFPTYEDYQQSLK